MKVRPLLVLLVSLVLLSIATPAFAQLDQVEYGRLMDAFVEAHRALEQAGPETGTEPLEEALLRDTELLEWVEAAVDTDDFEELGDAERAAIVDTRNRVQYWRAVVLLRLSRCDEASADAHAVVGRGDIDQELADLLGSLLAEAASCTVLSESARVTIECTPADAQVVIDGVDAGLASDVHEVELGSHRVVLSADGYTARSLTFEAAAAGDTVALGPVVLESVGGDVETTAGLDYVPWIVIGGGAALAIGGLIFDLTWMEERDELQQIQDECDAGCTDERHDQGVALGDDIKGARIIEGLLYGSAVAAIVAGVVLLVTGDAEHESDEPAVTVQPTFGRDGTGFSLGIRF